MVISLNFSRIDCGGKSQWSLQSVISLLRMKIFKVVSSLFPANVRDRLFEQDGKKPRKERTLGEALAGDQKDKSNESHHLAAHPAKLRLKNFLHDGPEMSGDGNDVMQSKPIADLVSVFILH